jgi:hypothetical protein
MGLSTSSDGSTSRKQGSPVGFMPAKEADLNSKNFNTYQDFTDLMSTSSADNTALNVGITNLGGLKLSEDGKTLVPNLGVDKSGVRRNKSTVADVLAIANAENDIDVGGTTQLTRVLGKNRELYLEKLKGLLSKLQNPEEMIQYTIQEGDKTFIRKQRTKDFLKEDASTILPMINQIGVKIE